MNFSKNDLNTINNIWLKYQIKISKIKKVQIWKNSNFYKKIIIKNHYFYMNFSTNDLNTINNIWLKYQIKIS